MRNDSPLRVEIRNVSKRYSGVQALKSVSLDIGAGTVDALIGENRAGNSMLVKILTGVVDLDEGEILVEGQRQGTIDPKVAHKLSIAAMYQEPTVFLDLTVAENTFSERRPQGRFRLVSQNKMQERAKEVLTELNIDFSHNVPVRGLSIVDRQMLGIAKALSADARLLIMDEPTASLSPDLPPKMIQGRC